LGTEVTEHRMQNTHKKHIEKYKYELNEKLNYSTRTKKYES